MIGDYVIQTSANFDPRSFEINSEFGIGFRSPQMTQHYWDAFSKSAPFYRTVHNTSTRRLREFSLKTV
jgi:phosphatidylserine/phosphatidylglycerophosphate/cardiolipin synthase-like enzyme